MAVNIRRLKTFALQKLPQASTLRDLLLAEADTMDASEFLAKMSVWLKVVISAKASSPLRHGSEAALA